MHFHWAFNTSCMKYARIERVNYQITGTVLRMDRHVSPDGFWSRVDEI